jgi:hypothetical protein
MMRPSASMTTTASSRVSCTRACVKEALHERARRGAPRALLLCVTHVLACVSCTRACVHVHMGGACGAGSLAVQGLPAPIPARSSPGPRHRTPLCTPPARPHPPCWSWLSRGPAAPAPARSSLGPRHPPRTPPAPTRCWKYYTRERDGGCPGLSANGRYQVCVHVHMGGACGAGS